MREGPTRFFSDIVAEVFVGYKNDLLFRRKFACDGQRGGESTSRRLESRTCRPAPQVLMTDIPDYLDQSQKIFYCQIRFHWHKTVNSLNAVLPQNKR